MAKKSPLERVAYSPGEVADLIGVTRVHVHHMLNKGVLPSFKIGASRRIPAQAIDDLIDKAFADRVAESRITQGLPPRVEDRATIARVAALVRNGGADHHAS